MNFIRRQDDEQGRNLLQSFNKPQASTINGKRIAPMAGNPTTLPAPTTTGMFPAPDNHAPAFKSGAGANWLNQSGMGGYQLPKAPTTSIKPIAGLENRQNALLQSLHEYRNAQRQAEYDKINSNVYLQALKDAGTMQNTELKGGFDTDVAKINSNARVQSANLYATGRMLGGAGKAVNPLDDMKKRHYLAENILQGVENYSAFDRDTQDAIRRRYIETGELPTGSQQTSDGWFGFGKRFAPTYNKPQNVAPTTQQPYPDLDNSFEEDEDFINFMNMQNRIWQ